MQNTSITLDEMPTVLPIPAREEEFFGCLIEQLAKALDADCAWLAEYSADPHPHVRTLAVCLEGRDAANFEYSLSDTPAEVSLTKSGLCIHASRVQELFPADPILRQFDANSYAGIPLFDSANELIGLIAVVSRKPLRDTRPAASLLRVFASRAVAELERLKSAELLRAREARLRLIFENTPDAHLLLTLDGRLVEVNRTAEELLGYQREHMIGRNVLLPGILPEEDLRRAAAQLARRAAGSPPTQQEYTIIRSDGSRVVVETFSQLASIDGVRMMLLCMRDITSRKAAQALQAVEAPANADCIAIGEALRRSEARLSRTQKLAALGSWERDLATEEMAWSEEVLRIYGIAEEEFIPNRQFFLDRVFPADLPKIDAAVNELLLSRDACQIHFRIVRPDGSLRHVRELVEVESNTAGQPARLIGSVQDITDLKQMEERFHMAQRMESLGRLTTGIAQGFNSLLMVVSGYSALIMRNPSNLAVVKNGMETIRKAGEDASHLVRQLLAFSHEHATETVVIDLNAVVREFDCMLRSLFGADIEVVSLLEPELGKLEASPAQLNQVLLSLAMNAREAMPRGGRLTMQTSNIVPGVDLQAGENHPGTGAWVVLTIGHAGKDVNAAKLNGPEMAAVQSIVQQCGGNVQIDARSGTGTTVRVFLPQLHENGLAENDPLAEESIRGNETVLVVDDQPEVRTLACSVLESLGYRVLSAPNADTAIRLSTEHRAAIHLLLTDVVMPGISGSELADQLRVLRPGMKVLFMSGYTTNDTLRRNDPARGTAFIRKPFDPFVLAEKMRELLGSAAVPGTILIADGNKGSRGMLHRVLSSAGFRILEASVPSEIDSHLHGGAVDLLVAGYSADGPFSCEGDLMQIKRTFPGLKVILIAPEGEALTAAVGVNAVLERPIQPDALISAVRKSLTHKILLETETN